MEVIPWLFKKRRWKSYLVAFRCCLFYFYLILVICCVTTFFLLGEISFSSLKIERILILVHKKLNRSFSSSQFFILFLVPNDQFMLIWMSKLWVFYVHNVFMLRLFIMFNFCMFILCSKNIKNTSKLFSLGTKNKTKKFVRMKTPHFNL